MTVLAHAATLPSILTLESVRRQVIADECRFRPTSFDV